MAKSMWPPPGASNSIKSHHSPGSNCAMRIAYPEIIVDHRFPIWFITAIMAIIYSINWRFGVHYTIDGPWQTPYLIQPSNNEPQVLELGCISLLSLQVSAIRASQNPRFFRVQLRNQSLRLQSKLCFPMKTSFLGQNSHSLIVFHQPCMELPAFPAVLEVSHPKDAATWRQSVNLQCCPGYDSLPTRPTLGANGGRLKVLNTRGHTKLVLLLFFVYHPFSWDIDGLEYHLRAFSSIKS